jgi:thiol-disulfide isomerase/thioredoxin
MPRQVRFEFAPLTVFLLFAALLRAGDVPRPAPPLAVKTPTGEMISLPSMRGKVVLLEFFQTTCPHCQHTAGIIEPIYKEWRSRGLEILAVAINPGAIHLIDDFRRRFTATYPIGVGDPTMVRTFADISAVQNFFVPYVFMIDRKGVIRAEHGGMDQAFWSHQEANLRDELDALLKEPIGKLPKK